MKKPTPSGFFRLEGALAREKRLTEASVALHTTLDLDKLLTMILSAACEGVGAERGTVFLLSEDGQEIWSKVLSGDESLEIRLPVGRGIAGTVARSGEALLIEDAYADARFDRSWDEESGYRTKQILCRPIRNREGEIVGVFQLLNKVEGMFDEADGEYLDALSVHAALAIENAQLHRSAIERERQEREILIAQNVQRAYQPERDTLELENTRLAGMNILCEDASGDYYDFIPLMGGRHAVVIGDVSGHGLGSAMVMAQARAYMHAFCRTVDTLAGVMNLLNDFLAKDLSAGKFMTMFVAVLDPGDGTLEWCNAGHPPGLLRRGDGSVEMLEPTGRILGVLPDPDHAAGPLVKLGPGDTLLLYTDGATEAFNAGRQMFSEARLANVLAKAAGKAPEELLDDVHAALCAWTGVDQMDDDLTLIALARD